jgi:TatD DNase family protein
MTPQLIDIGVNLGHRSFHGDRDAVIRRAVAAGVYHMVCTGTTVKSSEEGLHLARTHPGVIKTTAGVHPHNARDFTSYTLEQLRALTGNPDVVALGESGLDFNRDFSPRPAQERCFAAQIELACELGLPLFLHERDAHDRFLDILAPYRSRLINAVVHCFTGSEEALDAYLDLDLHIGITGWICDERRGRHLRALVARIPLDRLMLETDAPFLTPRDLRPAPRNGRNEPAFLPHIARAVADCRGISFEELAAATTATASAFFGLAPPESISPGEPA